ncbi:hypothetical protein N9F50_00775 [Akkermansiaceae bacterium]|nr:hypothetical protein [Akkermansiaceae bacterium]
MKNNLRHDFDEELDNDTVWNLLEKSSPTEASPTFLQDTLRRTRLEASVPTPWWKSLFSPKLLLGTSAAALAAIALVFSLNSPTPEVVPSVTIDTDSPTEEWNDLEDALASELLVSVTEVPSLLSDEEIVALIF